MRKFSIFFFIFISSYLPGLSQIKFVYDGAGNRISRTNQGPSNTCSFNISISGAGSVNAGSTVTLMATCNGNDCGGVSYVWSGDGISGTNSTLSFTAPAAAGNYTYTVTASKANCPQQTAYSTLTVTTGSGGGTGSGLTGNYFNNIDLAGNPVLDRVESTINFTWSDASSPFPNVNATNMSARWEGQIEAPVSGQYIFYSNNDDATRLWVNGQQLISDWPAGHAPQLIAGTPITLQAGQKYSIKKEFYQGGGGAQAQLLWSYPGQAQQVIPQGRLYPTGGNGSLPTNTCYTINIDQTSKRLQAMGDNSVQQQTGNGATNQIWKVEDRGNGQVSFTVQDGTGRSIQTVNGGNSGDAVTLGGYSGGAQQKWSLGNNPSATNQWRVSNAGTYTWDLAAEATLPQLQIWGNTGQGFYSYRSFRFEAATCPNGRMAAMEPGLEDGLNLHVSPNPSNGQVIVRFQNRSGQAATLRFTDLTGRSVRPAQTIAGTEQVHEERVTLPASVQGLLLISVEAGAQQASRKLVIER